MPGQIIFNQSSNGPTGHVNMTFIAPNGENFGTWGANIDERGVALNGLSGGVLRKDNTKRTIVLQTPVTVTDAQFQSAWNYVQYIASQTKLGAADYETICGNCVDFAASVLEKIGQDKFSIQNYLVDGSLLDIYANSVMLLCKSYQDEVISDTIRFSVPDYMWNYQFPYRPQTGATSEFILQLFQDVSQKLQCSKWNMYVDYLDDRYAAEGSPIALDLNGDGVRTLPLSESKVMFDVTGDSAKERTGWLDQHDGFLVLDRNGNGQIDGVSEMFGGMQRGEGYARLAALDSNGDSVLDQRDAAFADLHIWLDANVNGITDDGELKSLLQHKITSLGLDYIAQNVYQSGNRLGERSDAVIGGKPADMADVYFKYLTPEQDRLLDVARLPLTGSRV